MTGRSRPRATLTPIWLPPATPADPLATGLLDCDPCRRSSYRSRCRCRAAISSCSSRARPNKFPDDGGVEWAPLTPYWSVLWRSGVALAAHVEALDLGRRRVVELGCGLGLPSIAAARLGAAVLATDESPEALELLAANARANGAIGLRTLAVDWREPQPLRERGPFDLVLAADVLYEAEAVVWLLSLLPELAPEAWIATPDRAPVSAFIEHAGGWLHEIREQGVIRLLHLRFD